MLTPRPALALVLSVLLSACAAEITPDASATSEADMEETEKAVVAVAGPAAGATTFAVLYLAGAIVIVGSFQIAATAQYEDHPRVQDFVNLWNAAARAVGNQAGGIMEVAQSLGAATLGVAPALLHEFARGGAFSVDQVIGVLNALRPGCRHADLTLSAADTAECTVDERGRQCFGLTQSIGGAFKPNMCTCQGLDRHSDASFWLCNEASGLAGLITGLLERLVRIGLLRGV